MGKRDDDETEKDSQEEQLPFAVAEESLETSTTTNASRKSSEASVTMSDFLQQLKHPQPLQIFSDGHHTSWASSNEQERGSDDPVTVEMYDNELAKYRQLYDELKVKRTMQRSLQ